MKKLSALIILAIAFSSCSTTTESGIDTSTISVADKYMNAIQTKNIDKLSSLLSDDFKGYGTMGDSTDKAGMIEKWKKLFNAYDSIQFLQSIKAAAKANEGPYPGDYVTCWSRMKVTYKDGRGPVDIGVNNIFRVSDGKINVARTFFNEADSMRQLGYQFIPPSK
jgi:hypothetical protein